MKKQLFMVFGMAAIAATPAVSATNFGRAASSADLTGMPATRTYVEADYAKYPTRTSTVAYDATDGKTLYYTSPQSRSAVYRQYDNGTTTQTVRTTRAETVRTSMRRKYFLAHPFYQPLAGKFGSVTDFSYTMDSYKFGFGDYASGIFPTGYAGVDGEGLNLSGRKGKWNANIFSIKEDFSYGFTDRFAVLGMARYDWSKYKFKWNSYTEDDVTYNDPDDKMDDDGLNLFGIGPQWRFVDTDEWIATASAYYQHQRDISNDFLLELKAGYKVNRSTIYGLARGWYIDFDGNAYGNGVEGIDGEGYDALLFMAYKTNKSHAMYLEGGLGVFSVLAEDWTLNVEAILGDYDWHNQASIKGAIGWQPNDWFALNLYVKTSFYDSADDKKLDAYYWRSETVNADGETLTGLSKVGTAELSDYSETTVGLQVMFQF